MTTPLARRTLGRDGLVVSALGLGCMGMSDFYGPSDETQNLAVLEHALDQGVNFLDTADMYGVGRNEELLARGGLYAQLWQRQSGGFLELEAPAAG